MPNDAPSKENLLRQSKVFCILPWIHMHLWPTGDAVPCCFTNEKVGNLRESGFEDIWNNQAMRDLRKRMLTGESTSFCRACYDVENSGATGSLRNYANQTFAEKHWERVEKTPKDGSVADSRMVYLDFRFSNLCNFKCRSCGPVLSNSWYNDHKLLHGVEVEGKVNSLFPDIPSFLEQIRPHIDTLEEVYFAGGEPLITEEHYRILELLEEKNLFDVRLKYSTNFSRLSFRDRDVLKVWPKFKEVNVWASLDASGTRGEYMRKGQRWADVPKNLKKLRKECPSVKFFVQPTLSVFNAFHLPDFHRELVAMGVEPGAIHINPLFEPSYYRIQILPTHLKKKLKQKYREHIRDFLEPLGGAVAHSVSEYEGAIHYLESEDRTAEVPKFLEMTHRLDEIRKESFEEVFPELRDLKGPL